MGVIVSVNVGLPQDVAWQGRTVRTAVWKKPVTGRILAGRLNLDGDGQAGSSTQQAISANPASNPDQELGRRFIIKAENLPPPKSDPVAASRSLLIPYAGQTPRVMEGFTATPFVTGLEHPRRLLVLPNNDVIVAEQKTGHLTLLRDEDGDGKADYIERYADDCAPRRHKEEAIM